MREQIERYRLIEQIGKGSTGTVYRAEYEGLGGFRLPVALKVGTEVLMPHHPMLQESRLLAQIRHPNVVSILDAGLDGDRPFISLEWVQGETLHALIRQGPLPLNRSLDIALQLCDALIALHGVDEAIVHGDIKPKNILLSRAGQVKLLDFGSAKRASESPTRLYSTPAYLAPEQVGRRDYGTRADQFAFGTLLFEMLTGERLFPEHNIPLLLTTRQNADCVLRESGRLSKVATLHTSLAAIIARCVRVDPRARFESPRHLLDALTLVRDAIAWRQAA